MSIARRLRLLSFAALLTLSTLAAGPSVALAAAGSVEFGTPSASSSFGKGIEFSQPYSTAATISEANVVISYEGAFGVSVAQAEKSGSTLKYQIDTSKGQLQPNTKVTARFELHLASGEVATGPDVPITYLDDRFKWHTKVGKIVTLHWYDGNDSFASQALKLGDDGIAHAADFLGFSETERVDFYVYSDQQPFYDALGPSTRDNVGGEANSATRTLFALISPNEMDYARTVVPHELTHVVFDDVTSNPYHFPPHWLNEGVAVYVSQGYGSDDRSLVQDAVAGRSLMPLAAIRGQFPTTQQQFYLAYAEAVSAVDFFVRKYGHADLVKLLNSFKGGVSDDEAFQGAIGMSVDAFDKAWQADLGVTAMTSFGPLPAPTGPLPPGWTAQGLGGDGQPASEPTASREPAGPTDVPVATPTDRGPSSPPFDPSSLLVPVLLVGLALLVVVSRMGRGLRGSSGPPV